MKDIVLQLISLPIAVLIYITGQFILMFIITPLSKQRELISEIAYELTFNENNLYATSNSIDEKEDLERTKLQSKFRTLASKLEPVSKSIFFYNFMSCVKATLPIKDIKEARSELIGLSNGVFSCPSKENERGYQKKRVKKTRQLLKIS